MENILRRFPRLIRLFNLAKPYLERNDFGVSHTERVLEIAEKHFKIPRDIKELTLATIILHDIGGSSVKDQYEKGPEIASNLLRELGYGEEFIETVCNIIKTHHNRLRSPSEPFKILYDSDQLAKFSEEEFEYYNSRRGHDWKGIIEALYFEESRKIALKKLHKMRHNSSSSYYSSNHKLKPKTCNF